MTNTKVINNVEKCKTELGDMLFEYLLYKIGVDLDLDGDFTILTFYKMYDVDSSMKNIFNSSYRAEIFNSIYRKLYMKGYNCVINFDGKKVYYTTRVFNFSTRVMTMGLMLLTSFATLVVNYPSLIGSLIGSSPISPDDID